MGTTGTLPVQVKQKNNNPSFGCFGCAVVPVSYETFTTNSRYRSNKVVYKPRLSMERLVQNKSHYTKTRPKAVMELFSKWPQYQDGTLTQKPRTDYHTWVSM
jgi:hypothetical protein